MRGLTIFCGGTTGTVNSHLAHKLCRMGPFPHVWRERRVQLVLANYRVEPGSRPLAHATNKKRPYGRFFICGGTTGTRTLDPLIKSQLL